jgi:hypothetical protein
MDIVRLKKGKNDFAIANLTLGKILNIRRALNGLAEQQDDILAKEIRDDIDLFLNKNPDAFGDNFVSKIKANVGYL